MRLLIRAPAPAAGGALAGTAVLASVAAVAGAGGPVAHLLEFDRLFGGKLGFNFLAHVAHFGLHLRRNRAHEVFGALVALFQDARNAFALAGGQLQFLVQAMQVFFADEPGIRPGDFFGRRPVGRGSERTLGNEGAGQHAGAKDQDRS